MAKIGDDIINDLTNRLKKVDGTKIQKSGILPLGIGLSLQDVLIDDIVDNLIIDFKKASREANKVVARQIKIILNEKIDEKITKTGKLKRSLSVTSDAKGIRISYKAEYAAFVYFGGYIQPYGNPNANKVYVQGQPWIAEALQEVDLTDLFLKALLSKI